MKSIIVTSKPGLTPWITVSTMKVAEQEAKKAKAAGSRLGWENSKQPTNQPTNNQQHQQNQNEHNQHDRHNRNHQTQLHASMKTFILQSLGYTHCPEFNSLTEAREVLREMVADSLANAKRKSADATKHQLGTDSYSITLGRDKSSCLWAAHSIQPD